MRKSELIEKTAKVKAAQTVAATAIDDETALKAMALYPWWMPNTEYKVGDRVRHGDKLYKCRQRHTSQSIYTPDTIPALWEVITEQQGTHDNPISYSVGMALEGGKYYTEDGVLYICTRDTGIPVYQPLSALVGLYVEAAD